ncbi:NADP-dependent alcohol dehydrogenase C [Choiromyces venosus 120613-1]|uniref:NADP-dependent alcohol dehydrogenase C n=1 Tax=Choiromyces venosus 120613-1 TaxID=1336337 RepID=A0A3N4JE10_9PEZI|nr:NADP-dependent alcohol dehydrogenase C [Choiromyces venosus 120613-1]
MGYPDTFEGFAVDTPKKMADFDIDIKIEACDVCGSDVHTITGGWGDALFPLVVGHEIVRKVVNTGSKVTTMKKGDRVGVGAQIWSCLKCNVCKQHNENYCPHQVDTYGAPYPDGTITQGGYASHIRVHEHLTFKVPDGLKSSIVAPMLCTSLTTFNPLNRNNIAPFCSGGLGHFALMWINALGAEAYALSHTPEKKSDALALWAKESINTTQENWAEPWKFRFDMTISTVDVTNHLSLPDYFSTLVVHGKFWNLGRPGKPLLEIKAFDFSSNGAFIGGSHIGNREEMQEMMELAAEKGIKSWDEEIQVGEEGCKEAVERLKDNKVRYRFTLTGFDKVIGAWGFGIPETLGFGFGSCGFSEAQN